jgi:hypothetical protein
MADTDHSASDSAPYPVFWEQEATFLAVLWELALSEFGGVAVVSVKGLVWASEAVVVARYAGDSPQGESPVVVCVGRVCACYLPHGFLVNRHHWAKMAMAKIRLSLFVLHPFHKFS